MSVKNVFDRLFPTKYDFFEMLYAQAELNGKAADALYGWLQNAPKEKADTLLELGRELDDVRKNLEKNLVEAFSTPFDRGDIYLLSVSMHKVADYVHSTLLSMQAFEEDTNDVVCSMAENLKKGCDIFAEATRLLKKTPDKAERLIAEIRKTHVAVEELYRGGMATVFKGNDAMYALKKREIYHHLKDASSNLEECVDILHRVIVRLT